MFFFCVCFFFVNFKIITLGIMMFQTELVSNSRYIDKDKTTYYAFSFNNFL